MTIQNLSLLKALGVKMGYLNQRQAVISQNVANADTPGYRPKDLQKADFGSLLGDLGQGKGASGVSPVKLAVTNVSHMTPGGEGQSAKSLKQKTFYEVAPSGNAVIMEEQLLMAGQTSTDYNLMTSLYQKNIRLIKTALGTA
ncbi:MAG: flagellar basal body protein [Alphaproteobacteria bacterium]